jgi:hypothetical protein
MLSTSFINILMNNAATYYRFFPGWLQQQTVVGMAENPERKS